MTLNFKVLDPISGSFTYNGGQYKTLLTQLNHLDNGLLKFKISPKQYLNKIEELRLTEPNFVNTYTSIAFYWVFMSKPKKALDAALIAVKIAHRFIPAEFKGFIVGNHPTDIAYLRAMNIVLEGYMELRRYKSAVLQIQEILSKDPTDREGTRFILGSFAMRAGNLELANTAFKKYPHSDAMYFYEVGLCHMLRNEWEFAKEALRQGLSINPHFVDTLSKASDLHSTSVHQLFGLDIQEEIEKNLGESIDYVQDYGKLWQKRSEYLAFVREVQASR